MGKGVPNKDSGLRRNLSNRWYSMMSRCYDENHPAYHKYGGVGVTVCKRWHNKETFIEDLKRLEGYDESLILAGKLHLDKDINGKGRNRYAPSTCSFVSLSENNKHKPNQMSKFVGTDPSGNKHFGYNQSEFARVHSLKQNGISYCLRRSKSSYRGWTFEYV